MKRSNLRAVLALCAALALSGAARADVLEKVPADAWTVIKVNHLAETSAKFGKLAETLGWAFMEPGLADPLGMIKREMRINAGLDDDGEFAIVQLDPKGKRPDRSVITLIPTKDYAALVGGLPGAAAEGEITVYRRGGMTFYIADWGGYAALSPTKDLIAAAPAETLKLAPRTQEKWTSSDISVFANINALREPLTAALESQYAEVSREAPQEVAEKVRVDPKYLPAINQGIDRFFEVGRAFLRDSDGAVVSWTLSDEGVTNSVVAEFKPDSYLRKTLGAFQGTETSLLGNLPGESFLLAGGVVNSPEAISKLIDDVAGPILEKLPADDELSTNLRGFLADAKALLGQVRSFRTVLLGGDGPAQQAAVLDVSSDTFVADLRAFGAKYQAMGSQLRAAVGKAQGPDAGTWAQTITPDAKVVDGVNFDRVTFELQGDGEAATQRRDALVRQFGTDKLEHYVGVVDKKILTFSKATDEVISSLIAAVKSGDASLAKLEHVQQVSDALPKPRTAEIFITGEAIFRGIAGLAPAVADVPAMRVPHDLDLQLPPDLQPLGITIGGKDGTVEIDSFLPTPLMQALVTAALQHFTGQMMNGGGV